MVAAMAIQRESGRCGADGWATRASLRDPRPDALGEAVGRIDGREGPAKAGIGVHRSAPAADRARSTSRPRRR